MHGFNQGDTMATFICEDIKPAVLFLQEHWLTPDQMYKLCFLSSDYLFFGRSAMEATVTKDILIGRPFGGVSTLIHNSYKEATVNHTCSEKFVIVSIGSILLVNVYLPSAPSREKLEILSDILDEIFSAIENISYSTLIFGGDINCDPEINTPASTMIKQYLSNAKAQHCPISTNIGSPKYTHFQETLGHFSCIDHFFIANANYNTTKEAKMIDLRILESHLNFSDHRPITLKLRIDLNAISNGKSANKLTSKPQTSKTKNWEKANFAMYYDMTRDLVEPIRLSLLDKSLHLFEKYPISYYADLANENENPKAVINDTYSAVINAINKAASKSVPENVKHSEKFWWDEKMNSLKTISMATHADWISAGKPRSSEIFQARNKAKYNYRWHIKQKNSMKNSWSHPNCKRLFVTKIVNNFGAPGITNLRSNLYLLLWMAYLIMLTLLITLHIDSNQYVLQTPTKNIGI